MIFNAHNLEGEVWKEEYLLLIKGAEAILEIDDLEIVSADQVDVRGASARLRGDIYLEDNSAVAAIGMLLAVALCDIIFLGGAREGSPEANRTNFVRIQFDSLGVGPSIDGLAVGSVGVLRSVKLVLEQDASQVLLDHF